MFEGSCEHSSALLSSTSWARVDVAGDLVSSDVRILAPLILETVAWLQLSFAGLPINFIPVWFS